ncbi:L domain-like protein [Lichtheimia hyalospora FSU 10163]|nr:L domain-like protein [Lichtheimia hyalospora FSU 10163]
MAVSYLSGGRTLVGVVLPTYDTQDNEESISSPRASFFESDTSSTTIDWLGGISASFFTTQYSGTTTTASSSSSSSSIIQSPGISPRLSPCLSTTRQISSTLPEQEASLFLRRRGLDMDGLVNLLDEYSSPLDHLVELNVSRNLLHNLPQALLQMPHLKVLIASGNQLASIPLVLYHMRQLQELDLSENEIRDVPAHFPQSLPNLARLFLDGNRIESLPNTIGSVWATKMRYLRLGSESGNSNQLVELPDTMVDMVALEELHVAHNRLERFLYLPPQLQHLDLSYNQLQELPNDIMQHQRYHPLKTFNLAHNRLTALPESLNNFDALELLDVSDNQISVFPMGLLERSSLHILFTGNPVTVSNNDHQHSIPTPLSSSMIPIHENHTHISSLSSDSSETQGPDMVQQPLINSLHELALRQMTQSSVIDILPEHVSSLLLSPEQIGKCTGCQGPFIQEWVNQVQVKRYRGHPLVAREIRYCSTQCARAHAARLRETNDARQERRRISRPTRDQPLQIGSLEWIYAAADAAAEETNDDDGFIVEPWR